MTFKLPCTIGPGRRRLRVFLLAALALLPLLGPATRVAYAGSGLVTIGALQRLPGSAYFTSIACEDAHICYAAGTAQRFSGPGALFTLTDGTVSDEQTLPDANSLTSLACTPGGPCYAIGADAQRPPRALVFTIDRGAAGRPQTIDGVFLNGIACRNSGACYAVGDQLNQDGGAVIVPIAGSQMGPPQPAPGANTLYDIDCATADRCYAVGQSAGSPAVEPVAVIVPLIDGQPDAVQPVGGGYFHAIACPSPDTCYAVGYAGGLASTNEGQGTGGFVEVVDGQVGAVQSVSASGPLGSIVCPTASTCFAAGRVHNPLSAGATQAQGFPLLPWAMVPIAGNAAGDLIRPDAGLSVATAAPLSGDCPTSDRCYLLTPDGITPIAINGG
jgi:hypothetical protein